MLAVPDRTRQPSVTVRVDLCASSLVEFRHGLYRASTPPGGCHHGTVRRLDVRGHRSGARRMRAGRQHGALGLSHAPSRSERRATKGHSRSRRHRSAGPVPGLRAGRASHAGARARRRRRRHHRRVHGQQSPWGRRAAPLEAPEGRPDDPPRPGRHRRLARRPKRARAKRLPRPGGRVRDGRLPFSLRVAAADLHELTIRKEWLQIGALPAARGPAVLAKLSAAFPQAVAAPNASIRASTTPRTASSASPTWWPTSGGSNRRATATAFTPRAIRRAPSKRWNTSPPSASPPRGRSA